MQHPITEHGFRPSRLGYTTYPDPISGRTRPIPPARRMRRPSVVIPGRRMSGSSSLPGAYACYGPFGDLVAARLRTSDLNIFHRDRMLIDAGPFCMPVLQAELIDCSIGDKLYFGAFLSAGIIPIHNGASESKPFDEARLGRAIHDRKNLLTVVYGKETNVLIHK